MFEWIVDPHAWLALATLTILEIVLSIDNIIFLSLIVSKLPKRQQTSARRLGLFAAMCMRLCLLATLSWVMHLTQPVFTFATHPVSTRDLILFFGGIFLIWKSSTEINDSFKINGEVNIKKHYSFWSAILQIMLLDIIFSLDSVITAVGLSRHLFIMMTAVIASVAVMMFAARIIGEFVDRNPSIKMLALAFLVLVGVVLIFDSIRIEVPKGYIYFALFFSLAVEMLNLLRAKIANSQKNLSK